MTLDRDDQETRGALLHAQGVLTNCFQQCMTNLARVVDASLTDARLFQDWQSRRKLIKSVPRALGIDRAGPGEASEKDLLKYFPEQFLDHLEGRLTHFGKAVCSA